MEQPRVLPFRPMLVIFVGLQLGMVMSTMDGTIVATALPSIVRDLGGRASITWVVTAYLLTQIASAPLYGKIGDVYGRKRVYLFAITLFTVASMLCGLAQNQPQLIAARALQGLGSGALGPMAMAVLGDLVAPRQLGRWLGYQGAIFAVAGIAGPLAGGFFVDYLSWRWAFYFNLPLAIASIVLVATRLHVPHRRVAHSIDYFGSALLTGALAAFVALLTAGGNDFPWLSVESGVLVALVALLVGLFVQRERTVPEPFVPIRLLTNSVVRVADFLNLTSGLLFYCGIFFLPVFLQEVAGTSPTVSGLLLIPFMSLTAIATMVAGRRVERTGRYRSWPIAGGVLMTVGVALLATLDVDSPIGLAATYAGILGTGVGCVMQTTLLALQNRVEGPDLGLATSTVLVARTLGGMVGTALFGAVLAAGLPATGATALDFADALPAVFLVAVPFGVASFLAGLRLQEHPLREQARST